MSEEVLSFEEAIEKYDPVLGFEVHVELNTNTKMFDAAPNVFGDEPNTNITPVSLGLPGVLPVVNKVAVESAIKLGLALGCDIAPISYFARKNYFYPDSPKNFQTSQHHGPWSAPWMRPSAPPTWVSLPASSSICARSISTVKTVERAPERARAYVAAIREIVKGLGISDARMERGNVRCDANVSLMPKGSEKFGTRSETKNVNSLRSVERAVRYEIRRHAAILGLGAAR